MPEVSSLFTGVQIGAETTPGTSVAASKQLNYLNIQPSIGLEMNRFRPMGQRVASAITPGKDYTPLSVSGAGTYSEFIYPFSSLFGTVTPTTVDTTAKLWTWTPPGRTEMTSPKTFTIETGSATRAQKATYGMFAGLELTFNRTDGVTVTGGDGFAQALADNITLTATPSSLEDKPILPTHLDVYLDPTSGAIGTTKLTRDFNAVWRYTDGRVPVWPINSTLSSFGADVETEPTSQMTIRVAADSQGMGLLATYARTGAPAYLRFAAIAPAAYGFAGATTAPYQLLIDMAGKVSAVDNFGDDEEGVKVVEYTFDSYYDTAWASGQFLKIQYQSKTAAL